MDLTYNDLPKAVALLQETVNNIERLLLTQSQTSTSEADELLTVQDAADFLSLSKATVYTLISKGEVPVMKRSKRCYFSKSDLVTYLKQGRKKTNSEISALANQHLSKKT